MQELAGTATVYGLRGAADMNTDPLAGPRAKVERAKSHFRELEIAVSRFLEARPYEAAADEKGTYRVTRVAPIPIQISAITGDVLNNLRGTLDHIAYQAVCVGLGQPPAKPQEIQYPISDSAGEYPALRDRRLRGARKDALDAVDATKPYPGGNDALWQIHKLNNVDKHRFLLSAAGAFNAVNLRGFLETDARGFRYTGADGLKKMSGREVTYPDLWLKPADRMFPLEIGKELPSFHVDPDKSMQFRFDVAFGERPFVWGDPLLETLERMIGAVDALLTGFAPSLS